MKRAIALLAACAALHASPAAARADNPDPHRRVAVLEFRSGSAELPEIDASLARIMGKATSLDVIDATAARRIYGNQLDRDLVKCAGQARCVARIGKRLNAVEVLLVGVSEFGDVILTLQRIQVSRGKVLNRIAEALAPGAAPDGKVLRRYLERVMPRGDFLRFGVIRIEANVDGAAVTVDSKAHGKTPVDPIRLRAPASYEIRVTKPGYVTFSAKVLVPPDADVDVRTVLTRRTDDTWYKQWWVAALAGTVVVGAATAAVLLTRGDPKDVPVVVPPFGGATFRF
jgi:hypothetical protein